MVVPSRGHVWLFAIPWATACQAPLPPPSPHICSDSCPLCWWCYLTILSSAAQLSFAFHLSQHQDLFQWVSFSHQVAKVMELQLQHKSCQWIFRVDFLKHWLVWPPCSPRDSQESSPTPQFKTINSSVLRLLYGPALTFVHDYWKKHSFEYMDICWTSDVSAF